MVYVWVGIAGVFGALLRYWIGITFFTNSVFPFATLLINLSGSFLLAWLTTNVFKKLNLPPPLVSAIGTGFIGSFTTFSTLSVETINLFKNGNHLVGLTYIVISLFGGLMMSRLGFKVSEEGQKA